MPTLRQQLAVASLAENGGNVSKAMLAAGYSANTNTPAKLTRSKGFQQLMDKYLPERKLMKKHAEFLNAPRRIRTYKKGDLVEETEETDPSAVKALDMAYKLKGKYQNTATNNVLVINVSPQSADRFQEAVEEKPVNASIITPHDVV